nr:hypothetical protein [Tanacetum cinerariifolium]
MGVFGYPQTALAYHDIYKYLINCPLAEAFTKSPSVVYQNLLKEFWCTAIASHANLPTDDFEVRPLKEYSIKFSVMNGKKPLTLDFKTFTESTGLDYAKGKYVSHPSTEKVKAELAKIVDNINLLDRTPGPKASRSLPHKRKKPKSKKTPTKTKVTPPPEPTKDFEQSYLVSSGHVLNPQDPERNKQLTGTGLPSTQLDEGTRKSQLLLEGKKSDPKDSVGNKQPIDTRFPSKVFDEGTVKTTPLPQRPRGDKDSEGLKPPADMEPLTNPVADTLGTDGKYHAEQTQSARLRYRSLTENEGNTSSEVEPDSKTLQLKTFVDVQALLLSDDEMVQESDNEEVFAAGEDMDKDIPPTDKEAQSRPPNKEQPEPFHAQELEFDSSSPKLKKYDNILPLTKRQLHEEDAVSYADLRASIEGYNEENVDHKDQTDKLVQATMNSLDKNTTKRADLLKALNGITEILKAVQEAVKEDPALNKKVLEATKSYTANTKEPPFYTERENDDMQTEEDKAGKDQVLERPTKPVLILAFKPLMRPNPDLERMKTTSTIKLTDLVLKILTPNDIDISQPESSQAIKRTNKGKKIATDDVEAIEKLVPASKVVGDDHDEPVRVPYMINRKMHYLTNDEINAHIAKEDQIKKATEEAKMFEMTKTKVIKVVQKEAEKTGLDPKTTVSAKASEKFKKAQDAKHQVLKSEHLQKFKRLMKLNKKKAEQYMWTFSNRLKPEPITDVRIHTNSKLAVLTIFKNSDKRNFQVHSLFKFSDFGVTELDELGPNHPEEKEHNCQRPDDILRNENLSMGYSSLMCLVIKPSKDGMIFTRMELYMMNIQHGRMILESVQNGPLIWPTIEENSVSRPRRYLELTNAEVIQADCDVKATNIILQGLPPKSPQYGSPYQSQQYSTNQSLTPLSITYPSNDYQSLVYHNVYSPLQSIPQLEYPPAVNQQPQQAEFPQLDLGLTVLVFKQGEDPIDAINHMMSFLSAVVTSRFPTTNNQLRNSSNPKK